MSIANRLLAWRINKSIRSIEKAKVDISRIKKGSYTYAQRTRFHLSELSLQMGPNCNLECGHCYGCFGPEKEGLPSVEIVRKVLEGVRGYCQGVCLTDGEPLREENREVIREVAKHSKDLDTAIMTNGVFASDDDKTLDWLNFLKENGFDLGKRENLIHVSFGETYKVPWQNYLRIAAGVAEVFPGIDFGKHLQFFLLRTEEDLNKSPLRKVISSLEAVFDSKKDYELTDNGKAYPYFAVDVPGKSPIKVTVKSCDPDGRGKSIDYANEGLEEKEFMVDDLNFSPDSIDALWVGSNGDVSFGGSYACVRKGKIYGNVKNEEIVDICGKIVDDPFYLAFQLGGIRFMYALAQEENPGFKVKGKIRCHVCHELFENTELIDSVRKRLEKDGIRKSFKAYLGKYGLPKDKGV